MKQCKYQRNIEQLEQKGIDPKKYFLKKLAQECLELAPEAEAYLECLENGGDPVGTSFEEKLEKESSDVLNCIEYLIHLYVMNFIRIYDYQEEKQDIAFERGGDT